MTTPMATRNRARASLALRLVAYLVCVAVTVVVRCLPFGRTRAVVQRLCRGGNAGAASVRQSERALAVVDAVAAYVPGRVACLERSVSAVALLRLRRRRACWVLGVKTLPVGMHAWIEADGQPVSEAEPVETYTVISKACPKERP